MDDNTYDEDADLMDLQNQVKQILLERGIYNDWVHGGPHIARIRKNYKLLVKLCPRFNQNLAMLLGILIEVHDIGRVLPGDHAKNFETVFERIKIESMCDEVRQHIIFAAQNHSRGLAGIGVDKATGIEQEALGVLVLLDHMDAIGKIDLWRTLEWSRTTGRNLSLLSKLDAEKLGGFVRWGKVSEEMKGLNLKEESILGHLIWNYCVTDEIVRPVAQLLSFRFIGEIRRRKAELQQEIVQLIDLMKESEAANRGAI